MFKSYADRPRLKLPPDDLDRVLAIAGVVLMAIFLVAVAATWSSLPERVPTHFNLVGQADGWGSRGTMLLLPGIALFQFILLTVLARFPHRHNYPVPISAENAERLYRLNRRLLHALKVLIILLLLGIYLGAWGIATGYLERLPAAASGVFLAAMLLLLGWYFIMSRRAR